MKKFSTYFFILLFSALLFSSCTENEIPDPFPSEEIKGCYVVNYGSFGQGGASISKYDYEKDEMTNFFYQSQNGGSEILSNLQFAYTFNDSVFLIGNVADQLITVNPFIKQNRNGVSENINNPRTCVASNDYLYISCLGANPDFLEMPDSYIAKFNIITNKVEKVFDLPGGPEGLEIAKGKLYAALNYKDSVAVIDLVTEQVSYIETPAVTSYLIKDKSENLYVTLVSTWTDFSTETGIGYINTTTDNLDATYTLPDVSTSYGSMIQPNSDFTKLYLVTSAYDENWNLTGAVAEFNVGSKSFSTNPIVSGISGISGIAVNQKDDNIYVFSAQSTTGVGKMHIFAENGISIKDYEVGAFPIGAFFLE